MPQILTRFGVPAMLLGLAGAIVYALLQAASPAPGLSKLERLAVGPVGGVDFAFAGDLPKDAAFMGPDDAPLTLESFRGATTLVNFWATWCAPCLEEMPTLAALQTAKGGDDFQVIAISVDHENSAEFAAEELRKLTGGVLEFHHAPDYAVAYAVGARGFPTTVLFGPDGREIARLAGEADWASYEAIAFIDAAITR